jgi:hypothetical protein
MMDVRQIFFVSNNPHILMYNLDNEPITLKRFETYYAAKAEALALGAPSFAIFSDHSSEGDNARTAVERFEKSEASKSFSHYNAILEMQNNYKKGRELLPHQLQCGATVHDDYDNYFAARVAAAQLPAEAGYTIWAITSLEYTGEDGKPT